MNAKKKPLSILGDVDTEIYNTGSNRKKAREIASNEKRYCVHLAKEILKDVKKKELLPFMHLSVSLGLIPDDEADAWLIDIYEEMLKDIEHDKVIQNLQIVSKDHVYDSEFRVPYEVVTADFDFNPTELEKYLTEFIKNNTDVRQVIKLANYRPTYSKNDATITVGDITCSLGHDTDQDCFCQIMFRNKPNIPIEADDVWQTIKGKMEKTKERKGLKSNLKSLRDTMNRINNKVIKSCLTDEKLFTTSAGGKLFFRRF